MAATSTCATPIKGTHMRIIELDDIHAEVPELYEPHERVQVCPVAVDEPALSVHDIGDLDDLLFEEPQGVGVGEHQGGGVNVHDGLYRIHRQVPLLS